MLLFSVMLSHRNSRCQSLSILLMPLWTTWLFGEAVNAQSETQTQDQFPLITQCYSNLLANDVDDNLQLDSTEYLQFTKEYSNRPDCRSKFESNDDGSEISPGMLPIGIQVVFNQLSCECLLQPGADENCCLLWNANIPISGANKFLQQQGDADQPSATSQQPLRQEEQIFLRQVCLRTSQAIQALCGPGPTLPGADNIVPLPGPVDPPNDEITWIDKLDIFSRNGLIGFAVGILLLLCPLLLLCCLWCRRLFAPPPKYIKHSTDDGNTLTANNRDNVVDVSNATSPDPNHGTLFQDPEAGEVALNDSNEGGSQDGADEYRGLVDVVDLSSSPAVVRTETTPGTEFLGGIAEGDLHQKISVLAENFPENGSDDPEQPLSGKVVSSDTKECPDVPMDSLDGRRGQATTDDGDSPPTMMSKPISQPADNNNDDSDLMFIVNEFEQQQVEDDREDSDGLAMNDDGHQQYMVDTGESNERMVQPVLDAAANKVPSVLGQDIGGEGDHAWGNTLDDEEKRELVAPRDEQGGITIQLADDVAAAAERGVGGVGGGYVSTDDEIATLDTDELVALDETDDEEDELNVIAAELEEGEADDDIGHYQPIGNDATRRHLQEIAYNLDDAASAATTGEGSSASDLVLSWIVGSTLNTLDKDDELKRNIRAAQRSPR